MKQIVTLKKQEIGVKGRGKTKTTDNTSHTDINKSAVDIKNTKNKEAKK